MKGVVFMGFKEGNKIYEILLRRFTIYSIFDKMNAICENG